MTYSEARDAIFAYIRREDPRYYGQGFTIKPHLKVPQLVTPSGHVVRFKAQAVYLDAHSLWVDIRKITPAQFLEAVMAREGSSGRDPGRVHHTKTAAMTRKASAFVHRGRAAEIRGDFATASVWYKKAGAAYARAGVKVRARLWAARGKDVNAQQKMGTLHSIGMRVKKKQYSKRKLSSRDPDSLRERIAKALGWTVEETESFSLAALRDLVRPVSPKLASEISDHLAMGTHIVRGKRRISHRDPARRKRKKSLIEKTDEPFKGISIAYSPVNQAWFVLFGRGPIHTRSVIKVVPTKKEALEIVRHATSGVSTNDPSGRPKRRGKHGQARVRKTLVRRRRRG